MEQKLRVGVITKTHGLKGEVKVYPTTDSPSRFDELDTVTLVCGRTIKDLSIENVRYFKNLVILKFEGIDHINEIEPYVGGDLYIDRSEGQELGEDENYIADIIGMEVVSDEGKVIGTVKDVMETGANDVYIVKCEGRKDLLLPAIRQCILDVNVEENRMTVHLMDGLMEL